VNIKKSIIRSLRSIGYDITKFHPLAHPEARLKKLLKDYGIGLVFDIGANTGQYALLLRELDYSGRIVSFEPLSAAYAKLQENARNDALWECENLALGNGEGRTTIHIAANSQSSSILDMLALHHQSAPTSRYVASEEISLSSLDVQMRKHRRPGEHVFIKIDTQGYEQQVLAGATGSMADITGVELEMSLAPLYEGEMLFHGLFDRLTAAGFILMSLEPVFFSQTTGQLLQVNGIFFRGR
jgi:FkbM family methyltransferase